MKQSISSRTPKTKKTTTSRAAAPAFQTGKDLMTAVLVVSVLLNLVVLIGWLAYQVTDQYDNQLLSLISHR